jgi:hypothetical protein
MGYYPACERIGEFSAPHVESIVDSLLGEGLDTFLVGQNGSIDFGAEVFLLCSVRLVTAVDWTRIYI